MPPLFLLLSPTFGMHQYTADLAARWEGAQLLTTVGYPADRYAPEVIGHTPVCTRDTGFSWRGLGPAPVRAILEVIRQVNPSLVHITGPHVWNVPVLRALRRAGIPTLHTLHDLAPHAGSPYGGLLHLWNRQVLRWADHILVHSHAAREQALRLGAPDGRVTYAPLLHLFLAHRALPEAVGLSQYSEYTPAVLFFGRLERYKGVDVLLRAWGRARPRLPQLAHQARLILAGRGDLARLWKGPLPAGVQARLGHIGDAEALELFQTCGCLVLPYTGATQSALPAAAFYFRKPVIVTRSGALAEPVQLGVTGWVVPPGDADALAEALVEALSDLPRLAQMGAAGRAWYDAQRQEEARILSDLYARLGRGASG